MRPAGRVVGIVAGLLLAALAQADAAPVAMISQEQLLALEAGGEAAVVVLDVRTPEEFAAGHIPGAINLSHDQIEARLDELAPFRDRPLVVYCRSGRRTGLALAILETHGYTRLAHLAGDLQAWSANGRPIETAAPAPPAAQP